ncbi:hypothetical protein, partial [Streptomyces sp. NPDC001056]
MPATGLLILLPGNALYGAGATCRRRHGGAGSRGRRLVGTRDARRSAGGQILRVTDWRGVFVVLTVVGALLGALVWLR